jgi:uncharacterized protein
MRVRFNEISPQGSRYEMTDVEGLAEQGDFVVRSPMHAQCTLRRKGEDKVELDGRIQAVVSLVCDRCLGEYEVEVETEFQVLLEVESEHSWHLKEVEVHAAELDRELLDEPVVNLDDVMRQQLYLALPMKNLCNESCRGICTQCGANLNTTTCDCVTEERSSPFAGLARLKK